MEYFKACHFKARPYLLAPEEAAGISRLSLAKTPFSLKTLTLLRSAERESLSRSGINRCHMPQ